MTDLDDAADMPELADAPQNLSVIVAIDLLRQAREVGMRVEPYDVERARAMESGDRGVRQRVVSAQHDG